MLLPAFMSFLYLMLIVKYLYQHKKKESKKNNNFYLSIRVKLCKIYVYNMFQLLFQMQVGTTAFKFIVISLTPKTRKLFNVFLFFNIDFENIFMLKLIYF